MHFFQKPKDFLNTCTATFDVGAVYFNENVQMQNFSCNLENGAPWPGKRGSKQLEFFQNESKLIGVHIKLHGS